MVNPYRRPLRHLEYTLAAGYNLLQLTKKGSEVTASDVARTGTITALQIAAIYYTDKLVAGFITRGYAAATTKTLAGVQAAYITGAVLSVAIDQEEGLQNYNEFIDDVITADFDSASTKWHFSLTTIVSRFAQSDKGKTTTNVIDEIIRLVS
jgi:hypothetical protein